MYRNVNRTVNKFSCKILKNLVFLIFYLSCLIERSLTFSLRFEKYKQSQVSFKLFRPSE